MTPAPPPPIYPQQPPAQPFGQGPPVYPAQPYAGQPYMAPPYAMPPMIMVPMGPPGAKTFEGLNRMKLATLLAMVFNGIAGVGGLLLVGALGSITPGAGPAAITGALAAALGVVLLTAGIGLVALIFGILALFSLHHGRHEFGAEHAASAEKSRGLILYAVIVAVVGGVADVVISVVLEFGAGGTINVAAFQTAAVAGVVVGGAIGLVTTYLYALALEGYVERLVTAKGRAMRSMFIMVSMVGAVAAVVLGLVGALAFAPNLAAPGVAASSASLGPLASFISVWTMWMYRQQVEDAEQGCRNMIAGGTLNPDGGAPAVVAAVAAPRA